MELHLQQQVQVHSGLQRQFFNTRIVTCHIRTTELSSIYNGYASPCLLTSYKSFVTKHLLEKYSKTCWKFLIFRKSQSYDNLHVFLLRLKQLCELTRIHEPQQRHLYSPATTETTLNFTISEPCIVIHIYEKDQQDAHFFFK